jgi:hypothetical protein
MAILLFGIILMLKDTILPRRIMSEWLEGLPERVRNGMVN